MLLDRHIAGRFLANFIILFALIFIFAISIDLIVQLDEFMQVTRESVSRGQFANKITAFAAAVLNFHGPRIFQLYTYLLGLVAVGAMGFTLAQMHRHRELVAILASGISMHRIALPLVFAAAALNGLQMLNQEFALPRLAPYLIRSHEESLDRGLKSFEVPLVADASGNVLLAELMNPTQETLEQVTILIRNDNDRAVRRMTAESAKWDEKNNAWQLVNGVQTEVAAPDDSSLSDDRLLRSTPMQQYRTNLSPQALTVRRYAQYAQMLSLKQIKQIRQAGGGIEDEQLTRYKYGRFSIVLINMIVLVLTLPGFLLREPASLLRQSLMCAVIAIPSILGGFVLMNVVLPGLPPAVGVFFPAVFLLIIAMARWTYVRT